MTALQTVVNLSDKDMINTLSKAGASLKPVNRHDEESEKNNWFTFLSSMTTTLVLLFSLISIVCIISMTGISLGFYGKTLKEETKRERAESFREVFQYLSSQVSQHTTLCLSAISAFQTRVNDPTGSLRNAQEFGFGLLRTIYNQSDITIDVFVGSHTGDQVGIIAPYHAPVDIYTLHANQSLFERHFVPSLWDQDLREILNSSKVSYSTASEFDKFGLFYQVANDSLTPAWTPSYAQLSFPGSLFISFMTSVRDPITNQMQLFLGSDISTEAISLTTNNRTEIH